MEPEEYPWYRVVDAGEPLQQGDIFFNCPVVALPEPVFFLDIYQGKQPVTPVSATVVFADVIVLTHSCDIPKRDLDRVLVCPHRDVLEVATRKEERANIRKGRVLAYHLIEACEIEGYEFGQRVIDFRLVTVVPKVFLEELAQLIGRRVRLLPPYREKMAQAFAFYFGRIGLPKDPRDI